MIRDGVRVFDVSQATLMLECIAVDLLRASAWNPQDMAGLLADAREVIDCIQAWLDRQLDVPPLTLPPITGQLSPAALATVLRQTAERLRLFVESYGLKDRTLLEELVALDPEHAAAVLEEMADEISPRSDATVHSNPADYATARHLLRDACAWLERRDPELLLEVAPGLARASLPAGAAEEIQPGTSGEPSLAESLRRAAALVRLLGMDAG